MENINEIIPVKWTKRSYKKFTRDLEKYKDVKYLEFNRKTVFTDNKMIGIRIPILRRIASKIKKTNYIEFLEVVDDSSFEVIFLQGVVLSYIKDFDKFINYFNSFIQLIDNWAICDMCLTSLEVVKNNKDEMLKNIRSYIVSDQEFICRVGVILFMYYYMDDKYIEEVIGIVGNIRCNYYYVNMAIAWLLSDIFVSYKELVLNNLDKFSDTVIKMCVSKIRDSRRVSREDKDNILKYKKKTA